MIDSISIHQDLVLDNANKDQNAALSYAQFNRISWRAQLSMIDYLTGNIKVENAPSPPSNQKNRDLLAPLIKKYPVQVVGGIITRPDDYYMYDNAYKLNGRLISDCDDDNISRQECDTPIEILSGDKFKVRCNTYIDELKPSFLKPIVKMVGKTFEFLPSDLGSIVLEYVRYPVRATIVTKLDPVYNDQVPDTALTTHFEWDEFARELLLWFMTDQFANSIREQALKTFNAASNPKQ